jgi:hypothetical protein
LLRKLSSITIAVLLPQALGLGGVCQYYCRRWNPAAREHCVTHHRLQHGSKPAALAHQHQGLLLLVLDLVYLTW